MSCPVGPSHTSLRIVFCCSQLKGDNPGFSQQAGPCELFQGTEVIEAVGAPGEMTRTTSMLTASSVLFFSSSLSTQHIEGCTMCFAIGVGEVRCMCLSGGAQEAAHEVLCTLELPLM